MTDFPKQRRLMVETQLRARGISSDPVLKAFSDVPREDFVTERYRNSAYADRPLPIGFGQTISQPYVVALMVEALSIESSDNVLEVGAGCGYAAAILGKLAARVFATERISALAEMARDNIARLKAGNVSIICGDGGDGYINASPYDAILFSAASVEKPEAVTRQLRIGGRLVVPVGPKDKVQDLLRITRLEDGAFETESLGRVRFVPIIRD